jgi:hypothetical protein
MILDDLKHAQRERLIFLDRCLTWRGMANRRDLMARFGISSAQAALDFRVYLARARATPPGYDPVRKSYVAAANHRPLLPSSLTEAFAILSDGPKPGELPASLPHPERRADPGTIAQLHQAMRAGGAIHVCYTSMASGLDEGQWIAPTRFTSDGESVHVRAFSLKHRGYRNYLPIRIAPSSSFAVMPLAEPLPPDIDWNTRATIWLRPKPSLSEAQAIAVRREFGFEGAFLRVETRKALEFFFDRRWGLDHPAAGLERMKTEYAPILAGDDAPPP